jgi:hypothetical protein
MKKPNTLLMAGLGINLIGVILICASGVFADYIEGTDTTDSNGYGLDSAFRVSNGYISGKNIILYHMDGSLNGYFDYSFDDIKMAPESISCVSSNNQSRSGLCTLCTQSISSQYQIKNYCFVIKKFKDSTYSKIQILNNLTNNRYVFKYGTNTSTNNCVLEKTSYDRSIRYKPNNFNNIWSYYGCDFDFPGIHYCSWEAPLPNNNHLLGYMFFKPKSGAVIDTTMPINMVQWDSAYFTTSTSGGWSEGYLSIVAVYKEGKSDFLQNWWKPKRTGSPDSIKRRSTPMEKTQNTMEIKKTSNGFCISFKEFPPTSGSASLSIFSITGIRVAKFSGIKTHKVVWKTGDQNIAEGQYIIRLELSDHRVFINHLVFSR